MEEGDEGAGRLKAETGIAAEEVNGPGMETVRVGSEMGWGSSDAQVH